jgi:predicted deacylase
MLPSATKVAVKYRTPNGWPPAFQAMRRVNPSPDDLMDFGDSFPGRPRFATERIAEQYTALWKEHADFVVDLHTGGDRFVQHPFVIFTITGTVPVERMESSLGCSACRRFGATGKRCSSRTSRSTCRRWASRRFYSKSEGAA